MCGILGEFSIKARPIEEEEFNEIKERVIKGVIQNMIATIEEVEQLTLKSIKKAR